MIRRSFRQIRKSLAPSWLTTGEGELVGYALDVMKDAFVERARLGLLARFPQNGPNGETAPADALTAMGRDRRIIRGITETSAAYALRLIRWLDDHRSKGTAFTMMRQLAGYCRSGFSFRIYDNRGNCYSRSAAGAETFDASTDWDWDGNSTRWSRFWVVIYPTAAWADTSEEYGSGPGDPEYGDGTQWGITIPLEETSNVRAIVREWKPAGTRCVNIIVALDPLSFDPAAPEPDGTWGADYKIVAGVAVPARLDTARYLQGA